MDTRTILAALCIVTTTPACGGDDGGDTGAPGTTSTVGDPSSSTDPGSSSGTPGTSSGESTGAESSTDPTAADSSSTGAAPTDPSYPPQDAGACPNDTVPIALPGGSLCGPFCAGADAPCPEPSSGDATPVCTPFADDGGSGTPCTGHDDCDGAEACAPEGTCVAVAFWACRLECDAGQTCSDGMICAQDACAYE